MKKSISLFHYSRYSLVRITLIGCAVLSLNLSSCDKRVETPSGKTLAIVGGEQILESDLSQAIAESEQDLPIPQGESLQLLKKELLEQLIQTKIFLEEAKRENITLSNDELNEALKRSTVEFSEAEFKNLLKSKGLTYERWVQKLKENQTIQKLEEKATERVATPTPAEIEDYYKTHISDYKLKPGYRIRQILLPTEKEAQEVHDALLKGADFAQLASQKSMSPDKDQGGDLGVLTEDQMPQGFEITLSLPINAISPVIKTSYGFHIFRVEEKRTERIISLAEEAPKIASLLVQEKRDKQFAKWAIDLRNRTDIKIISETSTSLIK